MKTIQTVCSLCHQMCGINVAVENERVIGVSPMMEHERHLLCEKGYALPDIVHSPDRLTEPLIRKNGAFQKVRWDEALNYVASKLIEIRDGYGAKYLVTPALPSCAHTPNMSNDVSVICTAPRILQRADRSAT